MRTRIGIAVVEEAGAFLVGIRGVGAHLAGKAEFPGGKCDPDETPADCAVRECLEETGLRVTIDRLLCELDFDYPEASVRLSFFLCHPIDVTPAAGDGTLATPPGWQWVQRQKLTDLDFPAANRAVIEQLLK